MSAVTPEMIEAANKIVPGANDASICAVYLEMKALDPEVERLRELSGRLVLMCRRAGPGSDIYWAAVDAVEQTLSRIGSEQ